MAGELAPNPGYPERVGTVYERKIGTGTPGGRGPLRFEEGVATDTDIPNDFQIGVLSGYETAPGRPNHNNPVWIKPPGETMAQRAHVGSASWVEAPTFLGEFAHGSYNEYAALKYEMVDRSGGRYQRINPTVVDD